MRSSISLVLLVICTVVLAAQQSQAKKGCQAYGHVCYGGHGKRSLAASGIEQDDTHANAILQVLPNDLTEGDVDDYPRYRLIKIMKSWFGGGNLHPRRITSDRLNEMDYPISDEILNRDNTNAIN